MPNSSRSLLAMAIAAALGIAAPVSAFAQAPATEKTDKSEKKAPKTDKKSDAKSESKTDDKAKEKKPLTPQQQKMKECGAKWQDEKKAKGVSGKAAYQTFLKGCLKA